MSQKEKDYVAFWKRISILRSLGKIDFKKLLNGDKVNPKVDFINFHKEDAVLGKQKRRSKKLSRQSENVKDFNDVELEEKFLMNQLNNFLVILKRVELSKDISFSIEKDIYRHMVNKKVDVGFLDSFVQVTQSKDEFINLVNEGEIFIEENDLYELLNRNVKYFTEQISLRSGLHRIPIGILLIILTNGEAAVEFEKDIDEIERFGKSSKFYDLFIKLLNKSIKK